MTTETLNAGAEAPAQNELDPTLAEGQATKTEQPAGEMPAKDGETADKPDAGDDDAGERRKSGSARLRDKLRAAEAEIERLRSFAPRPAQGEAAPRPPKIEDFPSFDEYDAARTAYAVKQALTEQAQSRHIDEVARAEQAREQALFAAHVERAAEARSQITDFDAVIARADRDGVIVAPVLQRIILESDKSALLAYHLAGNPRLVAELNGLSPTAAARRVGAIESRLSTPQRRTETQAPPPGSRLRGQALGQFNPDTASHEDYVAMFARK